MDEKNVVRLVDLGCSIVEVLFLAGMTLLVGWMFATAHSIEAGLLTSMIFGAFEIGQWMIKRRYRNIRKDDLAGPEDSAGGR